MGAVRSVCAVATQEESSLYRITSYKLHVSLDGASWNTYQENNAEKVKKRNRMDYFNIRNKNKVVSALNTTEI